MEELERLKSIVRDLREKLWFRDGYHAAQDRVWEDEEHEARREERNRKAKAEWDAETERLCATK